MKMLDSRLHGNDKKTKNDKKGKMDSRFHGNDKKEILDSQSSWE